MSKWVCKPDGSIQCEDIAGTPLDVARKQLAAIIGADEILNAVQKHVIVPQTCGLPTGTLNAFELTDTGYFILFHGFVGPLGFKDCPHEIAAALGDGAVAAGPLAAGVVNRISGLTSVHTTPVLIRDLLGRMVRAYHPGDALTEDLRPERVNIEIANGRIADIWFG
ncbi:hypothetical protein [Sphingomonas sp. SUN039]|uniref:hypothetical protein n=1 Tax=Sphingomonas sp. SUN039 TaxID=2937787 RepID=UPI00216496D0|nr:hypothetical protein [Sphingomonas sp. SUN039]UVO55078.1 hypothetical protein M0209_13400 [Sphingomonas sp. SUN039]